ncbi:hypothetical protein WA026_005950 [Henosepilachna vigintioctopunctata]|uniref:Translation initiation factor eIF2B subunit alpha n=1 Tax=Henosepilachna vigintioctopunctata TaxID=420089 RepID=A0AAW1U717_9CUCU
MEGEEISKYFLKIIEHEDVSVGIAAIRTLMEIINKTASTTVQGLDENIKDGISIMKRSHYPVAAIDSGCELFVRFITLTRLDTHFEECKRIMLKRGNLYLKHHNRSRNTIVTSASKLIGDGVRILTHSRSRVVLQTLREAAKQKRKFEVYVTISEPDKSGLELCKQLEIDGIPHVAILDSSVGYIMEQIDFVMIGAECVVESGGVVNKIGSYTMAVCAREMNKPFYVLTESFKFSRLFPLGQQDLPLEYKYDNYSNSTDFKKVHPLVDYTPPSFITLLFTDIGILTPSAVSDELIKLYL